MCVSSFAGIRRLFSNSERIKLAIQLGMLYLVIEYGLVSLVIRSHSKPFQMGKKTLPSNHCLHLVNV